MPRPSKAAGWAALVTGANRGIGLAFVRELAARGAKKVYAGVRNPDALADEFAGLPAEVVPLDVTDPAAVGAAADACPDVNLLVNNAGLFTNTRLVRTGDPDAARREMEVNYFGVLNMTRAFAPLLGANGGGYIVNVLSVAGAFPAPFMGGYSPARRPRCSCPASPGPSCRPGHQGHRADRRLGGYPDGRHVQGPRKTRGTSSGPAWPRSRAVSTWPTPTGWRSRPGRGTPWTRSARSEGWPSCSRPRSWTRAGSRDAGRQDQLKGRMTRVPAGGPADRLFP